MANAGQLPALKTGKDFRYSWAAVRQVLRQPHQEPGEPSADERHQRGAGFRAQRRAQEGADTAG